MTALWAALLVAAVGCYALKLAGVSMPGSLLDRPVVQRVAALLPVAMLAALVVVELFDAGGRYGADWHTLAGMAAGFLAMVVLRQGVLVVFTVAVACTALLRLLA